MAASDPVTDWTSVEVTVTAADCELAADLLIERGSPAVQEIHGPDGTVLRAGFATGQAAAEAADAVTAAGLGTVRTAPITDDGLDAWRDHARAVAAGRWCIAPTGATVPVGADPATVITIEPGRTFGSGSHPTTRLVVADLDDLVASGARVLDVGCGSGVLSVVAARLGAVVTAIDIDEASPAVTRTNAEANGVAGAITVSNRPLAEVVAAGERFDVVAANLLAPTIRELAEDLVEALAPGGTLVVSGLLADRWSDTTEHLGAIPVRGVRREEGWASVVLGPAGVATDPRNLR